MTPAQQAALEVLARRVLTADEVAAASARDYAGLAASISVGRTKHVPYEIGPGTVLATLGAGSGAWIDGLTTIGQQNRDVFWALKLLDEGKLRIDMEATRTQMQGLAEAVPSLADGINALLSLCVVSDPVPEFAVRCALVAPWTARQTDFGVHPGKRMMQAAIVYTSASGEEITETIFADNLDAAAVRRIVSARIASLNARTAAFESLTEAGNGPVDLTG